MATATLEKLTQDEQPQGSPLLHSSEWQAGAANIEDDFQLQDGLNQNGGRRGKIRKLDVAEVTGQLAIMTKSGVDLASSLSSLAGQCQRPMLSEVLADVRESVLSGSAFSEALRTHPTVFNPTFVATIAAGEASGRMSEVLQQLATMQKKEIRRSRDVTGLLTYPVLLLLVSSSVLTALVLFVLPRFATIFDQYEMPLPVLTVFFLGISTELTTRWWFWLPVILGAGVTALVWRKSANGRKHLDQFWLRSPLAGEICRGMCIGATCRMLGLMLDNGVTLLESLRLTREAISNTLYKTLLYDLEDAVINGQGITTVLSQTDIVPPSAREMIVTAENTGNLNEVTSLLGEYYEEESEAKLRQLVGILEPLITVVMGGIVAVVVLSVMLPVFSLSTFAAGGN